MYKINNIRKMDMNEEKEISNIQCQCSMTKEKIRSYCQVIVSVRGEFLIFEIGH